MQSAVKTSSSLLTEGRPTPRADATEVLDAVPQDPTDKGAAQMDPVQLVAAFEQFGRLSEQLQQSYHDLDQRAERLTAQLASAQDERMRQLAEKEALAQRLETLLAALPAGVLQVDEKGLIQSANPAAEQLLEQSLGGLHWQQVYESVCARHTDSGLYLQSGRVLRVKTQPLEAGQGQIILLDDITEQRMLEELANRENRLAAMGQMAAGLAHQLRTPLASAVLYASQLPRYIPAEEKPQKAVHKIRTSLRYLEKLINDMLMYAKGGEFSEQHFALDDLLVTFNARIENRLRENAAKLSIISSENDISLTGSLDALVSVLMNLAENAIEASEPENCEMELEVYQQAGYLILVLRDNGPGLTHEQQAKIFQAFYTQREKGTGLGLAVAQSIVQAHHGDLLVRSQPGKGSNFYVCLPLQRGEQFLSSGEDIAADIKANKPEFMGGYA